MNPTGNGGSDQQRGSVTGASRRRSAGPCTAPRAHGRHFALPEGSGRKVVGTTVSKGLCRWITDAPERLHAVDEDQSDQSGRRTPTKHPTRGTTKTRTRLELLRLLGFSSLRQLVLVLVLEVAVAWFVLTLAVALVSDDPQMATLWQRLEALFSSHPTTLVFLLALAAAIVVPTFLWFHVLFLWLLVLWRRWRASQAQRSA